MDRRITRGGRAACAAVVCALFLATTSHAQLVELVSKADPGNLMDTAEGEVTGISADGRYVLFESFGSNLVPGQVDLIGTTDVFLRDRVLGTTVLVSHVPGSSVESVNDDSLYSTMNADGSYVFFLSGATNLVPGQIDANSSFDAFLWERATDTVTLVSHTAASTTTAGDGGTWWPNAPFPLAAAWLFDDVISADGSFLVFASSSTNLVAGQIDTNGDTDIFLYERTTGTTTLVSHQALVAATAGDNGCSTAHISADGAAVVFSSAAANHVAGQVDANFTSDVFVYDRLSGNISLASHTGDFVTTGDGYSRDPEVSADGAFVAFIGTASNLVAGQVDTNFQEDVFVYDVGSQSVTLVSHTDSSPLTTGDSFSGMGGFGDARIEISANGDDIAYLSRSTNLVAGQIDTNFRTDAFLFDRVSGTNALVSHASGSPTTAADDRTLEIALSDDGSIVAFSSWAGNLVPGQLQPGPTSNVFVDDRGAGTTSLVSHTAASAVTSGDNLSAGVHVSGDGVFVAYASSASDLESGVTDLNQTFDAFVYDRGAGTNELISRIEPSSPSLSAGGTPDDMSADGRYVDYGRPVLR